MDGWLRVNLWDLLWKINILDFHVHVQYCM